VRKPDFKRKLLEGYIARGLGGEVVPLVALGKAACIIELPERNFTLDPLCFVHTAFPVVQTIP